MQFSNRSRPIEFRSYLSAVALSLIVFASTPTLAGDAANPGKGQVRNDLTRSDLARVRAVTKSTQQFDSAERFEAKQGGAGTSTKIPNRNAFSHSQQNLKFEQEERFKLGNALFRKIWVAAPASTKASDGLGPLFNAKSCQSCHIKDGRGRPPIGNEAAISMFLRLSRPASTPAEMEILANAIQLTFPDPVYGGQLQNFAVAGVPSEGRMHIDYEEIPVELGSGEIITLRKPTYSISNLSYGKLHSETTLSPRVAPPMIGMGLIEQIHGDDILAAADPKDANGDGISGKPQLIADALSSQVSVGRFGWKAQNFSIRAQSAEALAGDIGVSSPDVMKPYGDCTLVQQRCREAPMGIQPSLGDSEAPDPVLDLITFYSRNLAVPARRNVDAKSVLAGKKLFYETGCVSCHKPKYVTRKDAPDPAHRFQLIWPYSDFLLHDMGEGLADGQSVGAATGNEWRTPPLWGIGLTKTVGGHTFFLHDGRARNLTEAILWHGGEAKMARDRFAEMSPNDRQALIDFLESL